MAIARLPGMDLAVGFPVAVATIIRELPLTGPITMGRLLEAGAALLQAVPVRQFTSRDEIGRLDEEASVGPQEPLRPYTDMDGVYIRPGPSWLRSPR